MTLTSDDREVIRAARAIQAKVRKEQRLERKARAREAVQKIQHARVEPAKDGKQRQPRLRDKLYLGWVSQLPCVACLRETGAVVRPVHVAHVRFSDAAAGWKNPGLQCKPGDDRTTPLCPDHHIRDQHAGEERAFWERLGIWPPDLCADLRDAFTNNRSGEDVLRQHCIRAMSAAIRARRA